MKKFIVFMVIFLVIGGYLIVLKNGIDLHEKEGKKTFVYKFSSWVWQGAVNVGNVAGYAFGMKWLPQDEDEGNKTINGTID